MTISNAAIADLTVPSSVLQADNLLTFFLSILPPHQIHLTISASSKATAMRQSSLILQSGNVTLTSRNAILMALSSLVLLNKLDNYPFYLLGGYAEGAKSSTEGAMVLSSISSYMELAQDMRTNKGSEEEFKELALEGLNEILEKNAFLVGNTFRPTLADYDVCYALCEMLMGVSTTASDGNFGFSADSISAQYVHVKRWIHAVAQSALELLGFQSVKRDGVDAKIPFVAFSVEEPVPVFSFGEEEENEATSAAAAVVDKKQVIAAVSATQETESSGSGGKKELSEQEKKEAAEKRAKKAAEKKAKKSAQAGAEQGSDAADKQDKGNAAPPSDEELNVTALDIRVGKILEVWEHEASDKLWCEKIDIGEAEPRQILSGLRAFYKKEDMQDRTVLVLCNLKKRNLVGVPSHGMVLCASNSDHTAVEFVVPPEGAKIGERLTFEGLSGEPEPENKVHKKKLLEKLAPDLKTNDSGVVVWKGFQSMTSAGPCVAVNGMKDAQVS